MLEVSGRFLVLWFYLIFQNMPVSDKLAGKLIIPDK